MVVETTGEDTYKVDFTSLHRCSESMAASRAVDHRTLMGSRRNALVLYIRIPGRVSTGALTRMYTDCVGCATEDGLRQSYEEDFYNSVLSPRGHCAFRESKYMV